MEPKGQKDLFPGTLQNAAMNSWTPRPSWAERREGSCQARSPPGPLGPHHAYSRIEPREPTSLGRALVLGVGNPSTFQSHGGVLRADASLPRSQTPCEVSQLLLPLQWEAKADLAADPPNAQLHPLVILEVYKVFMQSLQDVYKMTTLTHGQDLRGPMWAGPCALDNTVALGAG